MAKGDLKTCYAIMKYLSEKPLPANRRDPVYIFSALDFSGDSFIAHPDALIHNAYKYTLREIVVYFSIAALRNLSDYLATGDTTIDTCLLPEDRIIHNSILKNRLLNIDSNGMLHFLYEEVTKEKK